MPTSFETFEFISEDFIDSLSVKVQTFRHKVTGAMHYHLAADDDHKVFMVALRTVPEDSTGVAHILEHTVLCGSERYPVRDPFFMMIRRSINTFMNAFTSSDWTAYPFATENDKDFKNLLDVYMDAVFFPNLDPLDFAQEGHRFEFETPTDASSPLTYKGVVFNEMKGAMSSPVSTLWQVLTSELYPTSTYHYNSGGEPEAIPDLTHAQLVEFHRSHYHPSNAVFMTYGNQTPAELQADFERLALARFSQPIEPIYVETEQRFSAPKVVEQSYALDEEDTTQKTHIVLGWLLGLNKDPMDVLKGHLLASVLLDNSASPLRFVLEQTELATAPSPLCGLEDSNKEMAFVVGVQGSEPEHAQAVEDLIINELQRIVDEGIDQSHVEAMLHQLELSQREVGGDSYPYGLELMLGALPAALHQGDPVALLDVDKVLLALQEEVSHPDFIPNLVQAWLLDNPHRVRLTLKPDANLNTQREQAEKAKLATIQQTLTVVEQQAIIDQAVALEQRQAQQDDPTILPSVTKDDVNPEIIQVLPKQSKQVAGGKITAYERGTNGLVYQQLIVDMPDLTAAEQTLMPLFNSCLTEVGSGGRDYLTTQSLQAAVTGGLGARSAVRADILDKTAYHSHFMLTGKALNRHQQDLADLMQQTLLTVDFSETARLRDLVAQIRSSMEHRITGAGHSLAMSAAAQAFSPVAQWNFQRSGLAGIQFIKQLDKALQDQTALEDFAHQLAVLRDKIASAPKQALLVADDAGYDAAYAAMGELLNASTTSNAQSLRLAQPTVVQHQAWLTSTQVNFCAQAYPAVMWGHEDAPLLSVMSACLRNGFLHSAIREKGGAYGGGASFDAESGALVMFSYRDPRLMETYADFDRALDWLMTSATQEQVDEAILNIVSAMDKPGSPAGEAKKAFYQELYGRDHDKRVAYRQAVLNADLEQVKAVAQRYIQGQATRAVLTQASQSELLTTNGFELIKM
ncbi:insulinase family protein [Thiomicrospira cyclica]|uniref:Peptidase M16C associated domain protein n=1 Tax=Thiomicrospira cyclica (strain DSM 14477 / JCM 11371 / ALM1) TaxID=717773 RepID=F6DCP4_THICA|nr:insulinase family protein [Thiomicrospira cyclica]AEG31630.1 Peptidase M16C associated domain protein [Thiomicrospira cyclica ALM1]